MTEKPAQYRYEAPSPELCERIRSVRSVQPWPLTAVPCPLPVVAIWDVFLVPKLCLTPRHRGVLLCGSVSPARSLLTPVWFRRISKAMLKWACWILTDREGNS